jgi:hypothetical protein
MVHQRPAQLVKSGERELHLRLNATGGQDAAPRVSASRREILQQRGLSYARLPLHQECLALAALHLRKEFIEPGALAVTADERVGRSTRSGTAMRLCGPIDCRPVGTHQKLPS